MHGQRAQLNEANWVVVTHEPDGALSFFYRPYGTPGMRLFAWVALAASTGFLGLSIYDRDAPWFFIAMFAVFELLALGALLYLTFATSCLRLTPSELILETRLGTIRRTRRVPKTSIRAVRQINDHADQSEPDSFPTFSLRLDGEMEHTILSRQDSDRSHYLGTEIASWAGVPYLPARTTVR